MSTKNMSKNSPKPSEIPLQRLPQTPILANAQVVIATTRVQFAMLASKPLEK